MKIPQIDDLSLPEVIKELAMTKRGLIMFVGATGTGKSTSLAAMLGHRNRNSRGAHHFYRRPDRIRAPASGLYRYPA